MFSHPIFVRPGSFDLFFPVAIPINKCAAYSLRLTIVVIGVRKVWLVLTSMFCSVLFAPLPPIALCFSVLPLFCPTPFYSKSVLNLNLKVFLS